MKAQAAKKFEILEESPSVRLKVFGSSPKELFQNAIQAMAYVQKPELLEQSAVGRLIGVVRGRRVSDDISLDSMDYSTLLVDFLGGVLSRSENHNAVFLETKFKELSELKAEGRLYGVKVADFSKNIKSIAFHEVEVKEIQPGKWECLLVFDI